MFIVSEQSITFAGNGPPQAFTVSKKGFKVRGNVLDVCDTLTKP